MPSILTDSSKRDGSSVLTDTSTRLDPISHPNQSIGRLADASPPLEALEIDDKPSVIIDYWYSNAADELRLVNAEERIYLGRATNWYVKQVGEESDQSN